MSWVYNGDYDEVRTMDTDEVIDELALYTGVHTDVFEFIRSTFPYDRWYELFSDVTYWACGERDAMEFLADALSADLVWDTAD